MDYSGHLSWKREYHLVLLGGLDCPTHFPATDTTESGFVLGQSLDRAALCAPCVLAGEAVKLISFQLDFLLGVLLFQKLFDL